MFDLEENYFAIKTKEAKIKIKNIALNILYFLVGSVVVSFLFLGYLLLAFLFLLLMAFFFVADNFEKLLFFIVRKITKKKIETCKNKIEQKYKTKIIIDYDSDGICVLFWHSNELLARNAKFKEFCSKLFEKEKLDAICSYRSFRY